MHRIIIPIQFKPKEYIVHGMFCYWFVLDYLTEPVKCNLALHVLHKKRTLGLYNLFTHINTSSRETKQLPLEPILAAKGNMSLKKRSAVAQWRSSWSISPLSEPRFELYAVVSKHRQICSLYVALVPCV